MDGLWQVLLGAFLALVGGVVTLFFEKKWEAKNNLELENEKRSALAFSILVKLTEMVGWTRSVKRAIDECFSDLDNSEAQSIDPGVKVQPIVGAGEIIERLTPEELSLLLVSGDQGLLENALRFQGNYRSTFQTLQHFNASRQSYSDFVRGNAESGEFEDGAVAKVVMSAKMRHRIDAHISELNQMVAVVLDSVEQDRIAGEMLVTRVQSAFASIKGLKFPIIRFESEMSLC